MLFATIVIIVVAVVFRMSSKDKDKNLAADTQMANIKISDAFSTTALSIADASPTVDVTEVAPHSLAAKTAQSPLAGHIAAVSSTSHVEAFGAMADSPMYATSANGEFVSVAGYSEQNAVPNPPRHGMVDSIETNVSVTFDVAGGASPVSPVTPIDSHVVFQNTLRNILEDKAEKPDVDADQDDFEEEANVMQTMQPTKGGPMDLEEDEKANGRYDEMYGKGRGDTPDGDMTDDVTPWNE